MPEAVATKSEQGTKQPVSPSRGPGQHPHGSASDSRHSDVLALHRTAGNRAVATLMDSQVDVTRLPLRVADTVRLQGRPLDSSTREYMESRFAQDFSRVEVHTDATAADSADAVNAKAYTVGNHIVFGSGFYEPETTGGRSLLAHELAHVVQQTNAGFGHSSTLSSRGDRFEQQAHAFADSIGRSSDVPASTMLDSNIGLPPLVQREEAATDTDDEDSVGDAPTLEGIREGETDNIRSVIISTFYGDQKNNDTSILIDQGVILNNYFLEGGPRSKLAAAQALLSTYHVLRERAKVETDSSGVLMHRESFGTEQVPWTPSRPHRVEDIAPFTPENVQAWSVSVLNAPQASTSQRQEGKTSNGTRSTPDAATVAAPPTPPKPISVGTALESQPESPTGSKAGGPDISAGLSALKGVTLGKAIEAMSANINEIASGSKGKPVPSESPEKANISLFSAANVVLYVANRIYVLDRSGHISGEEFNFDLSGVSLARGTYFVGPFRFGTKGTQSGFETNVILRVDGAEPKVAGGDIFPSRVLTGVIPLLDILKPTLAHHAGIGVIISPQFGQKRLTLSDFSAKKVGRALKEVPKYLEWAIRSQIAAMIANPVDTLAKLAFGEALSEFSRIVPEVGAAVAAYQSLRTIEWLGNTVNMAAYAISEDEVDIASQSMAQRLAGWIIGKLIDAGKAVAKKGISLAVRAATSSGNPPARTSGTGEDDKKDPGTTGKKPPAKPTTQGTTEDDGKETGKGQGDTAGGSKSAGAPAAATGGTPQTGSQQSTAAAPQKAVPGRVQSRINLRKGDAKTTGSGLEYAWRQHGGGGPSGKSQFTIPRAQVEQILQRPDVVKTPARVSGTSGNFIREIDLGPPPIGNLPANRGGIPTSVITVITDNAGNVVNTFPGALGRGATLPNKAGGATSTGSGAGKTP